MQMEDNVAATRALPHRLKSPRTPERHRLDHLRRRLTQHFPRQSRAAASLVRVAWWVTTLQFRKVRAQLQARAALLQNEALLAADALLDFDYYRQTNPGLSASGLSPERHYLVCGRFLNSSPHPLFDGRWYSEEYRDIGDDDPLVHYIKHGRAEGRWPNALFDPAWYCAQHPELTANGMDPLQHFLHVGAAQGYDPSPRFKTRWYRDHCADAQAKSNPLAHYLRTGTRDAREGHGYEVDFSVAKPVTDAAIECRKRPVLHSEVALFVTHSPDGRLKPHVRTYLEALVHEGIAVTLIVAGDHGFTSDEPWLYDLLDGLYIRANEGWDFAAWAHVLRLNRGLYCAEVLYWLNDSLVGPVSQAAFHALLERVRAEPAGLVGLTANYERGRHIQSYFMALKREALQSFAFHEFVLGIKSFAGKEDVINAFEITFAPKLEAFGVSVAAIFEPSGMHNPTVFNWRELLEDGLAFVKVSAITRQNPASSGWRQALSKRGYDVTLADQLLAGASAPSHGTGIAIARPPPPAPTASNVAFIAPFNYGDDRGAASRGYLSALMHTRLPLNAYPITQPTPPYRRVTPSLSSTEFIGPADVALVHLDPTRWPAQLTVMPRRMVEQARHRIGIHVGASAVPLEPFTGSTGRLSAIWAPTRHCAARLAATSNLPIHLVPYAIPVRPFSAGHARVSQLKRELGISPDDQVVFYSSDANDGPELNNALALIRAYHQTGLAARGWRLLLQPRHTTVAGDAILTDALASITGTVLLRHAFTACRTRLLMDAADLYVSPGASPGFDLNSAAAMAQGKAVIACEHGGSSDFLDASCGFPIRSDDEDALAAALATVAAMGPRERAAIGGRARRRIETQLSPAAVAVQIRASLNSVLAG